jgi:DNA-directed RNA polymerase subunit M/transcription elongation factor TFIIS
VRPQARCPNCGTALTPEDFSEVLETFTCSKCGLQIEEGEAREDEADGSEV